MAKKIAGYIIFTVAYFLVMAGGASLDSKNLICPFTLIFVGIIIGLIGYKMIGFKGEKS